MKKGPKQNNNFREMISGENGVISSKRVMGVIVLTVCVICTCWLVYAEGGTQVVENLLQTLMIMAAALLGISTITGIWRNGKHSETAKTIEEVSKEDVSIEEHKQQFDPDNPCATCIHNKNKEVAE